MNERYDSLSLSLSLSLAALATAAPTAAEETIRVLASFESSCQRPGADRKTVVKQNEIFVTSRASAAVVVAQRRRWPRPFVLRERGGDVSARARGGGGS